MKGLKIGALLFGIVLLGLGVGLAVTNPSQAEYEAYATDRLADYLSNDACEQAPEVLRAQCDELVENNQDQIQEIVADSTQRQNFIILSVYTTNLSFDRYLPPFVNQLLPSYHFETVGIFQTFHTYRAEQQ